MGAFTVGEVALALWVGEALVLVAANDVQLRMIPPEAIGMPAEEIIVAPTHRQFLVALRHVFALAMPVRFESAHFEVTVDPVPLADGRRAVVSAARLVRPIDELPDADALRPLPLRRVL